MLIVTMEALTLWTSAARSPNMVISNASFLKEHALHHLMFALETKELMQFLKIRTLDVKLDFISSIQFTHGKVSAKPSGNSMICLALESFSWVIINPRKVAKRVFPTSLAFSLKQCGNQVVMHPGLLVTRTTTLDLKLLLAHRDPMEVCMQISTTNHGPVRSKSQ